MASLRNVRGVFYFRVRQAVETIFGRYSTDVHTLIGGVLKRMVLELELESLKFQPNYLVDNFDAYLHCLEKIVILSMEVDNCQEELLANFAGDLKEFQFEGHTTDSCNALFNKHIKELVSKEKTRQQNKRKRVIVDEVD
jgi:hypothetical protein